MFKYYKIKNYHFQLILYLIILSIIGILVIGSAKESVQNKQIFGLVAGLVFMIVISLIDYSFILKFPWLYYIAMLALLIAVEVVGDTSGGAQRWIDLKFMRFQPSEVAKIIIILFFAYYYGKYQEKINSFKVIGISFILSGIPLYLILKQPDLSTTIVSATIFVVLLFIGGLSYKIVLSVLAIAVPSVILVLAYVSQQVQAYGEVKPYQLERIAAWLYPMDPRFSDKAAQQQNAIMAIGSGQLWGKGLNNSAATSMKNTNFIVEPQTDFIFAVVGEELGFLGTATIIILLFLIVLECIYIGSKAKDLQGRLICCGMAAYIGFQSFVNICVATGLFPNTGIPLPFVSYGLTSLLSAFIGMGFVLNVGLQPKKY